MRTHIRKILRESTLIHEHYESSNAVIEKAERWIGVAKEKYKKYGQIKNPLPTPDQSEFADAGLINNSPISMNADELKRKHGSVYEWILSFMVRGGFSRVDKIFPLKYWNDEFWAQAALCHTFNFITREIADYLKQTNILEHAPEFFFWMLILMPNNHGHQRFIRWYKDRATEDMKWYVLKNYEGGISYIDNPTDEMNDYAREKDPKGFDTYVLTSKIIDEINKEDEEEYEFLKKMRIHRFQVAELNPNDVDEEDKEVFNRLLQDIAKKKGERK